MAGKGNLAQTEASKKIDDIVKRTARKIYSQKLTKLIYEEGHENNSTRFMLREFIKKGLTRGMKPDGGLWFNMDCYSNNGEPNDDRKCVYIFEAKHQGNRGNAIERWADNFDTCQQVYPDAKYITFMSGLGCTENGTLTKFAYDKKKLHNDKVEFYLKKEGFTENEIMEIMLSYLNGVSTNV